MDMDNPHVQDQIFLHRVQEQQEIWQTNPDARVDILPYEKRADFPIVHIKHKMVNSSKLKDLLIRIAPNGTLRNSVDNPEQFGFRSFRRPLEKVLKDKSSGMSTLNDIVIPNIQTIGAEYDPLYSKDVLLPIALGEIEPTFYYFTPMYPEINDPNKFEDEEDKSFYEDMNKALEEDPFSLTTAFSGLIIYRRTGIEHKRYFGLSQVDGDNYLAKRVLGLIVVEWVGVDSEQHEIPKKLEDYYKSLES